MDKSHDTGSERTHGASQCSKDCLARQIEYLEVVIKLKQYQASISPNFSDRGSVLSLPWLDSRGTDSSKHTKSPRGAAESAMRSGKMSSPFYEVASAVCLRTASTASAADTVTSPEDEGLSAASSRRGSSASNTASQSSQDCLARQIEYQQVAIKLKLCQASISPNFSDSVLSLP